MYDVPLETFDLCIAIIIEITRKTYLGSILCRIVLPPHMTLLLQFLTCPVAIGGSRGIIDDCLITSLHSAGVDLGGIPLSRAPQIFRRNTTFAGTVIRPDYQLLPRFGDPI